MKLKEKLISLRKSKGLSQLKLAEMMNISRQAVSRWEVGIAVPSTDNLKYLGHLYDVPLEYLLHDDAPEPVRSGAEKMIDKAGKNRKKNLFLVLIGIGVILMILLCAAFFGKEPKGPVPMDNIEGSVVDTVSEENFKLDW